MSDKYAVRVIPTRYANKVHQEPCVVLAEDENETICTGETMGDARKVCAALNEHDLLAIRLDIAERALLDVAEEWCGTFIACHGCPLLNLGCLADDAPPDDRSCAERIAEQAKEKVAKESDER